MRHAVVLAVAVLSVSSSSLRAQDDAVLYSDNFATLDPGWGNADAQHSIKDGKLVVQPTVNTNYTSLYQGNVFGDADVTVKVVESDGGNDEGAGIAFWGSDINNFYVAELQSDGQAGVLRLVQGQWVTPVNFAVQDFVTKGIGQTNELRVVTTGNLATVYINGKQLAALRGAPPTGGSQIGLHAESGAKAVYTWQFSNFMIRKPGAAPLPTSTPVPAMPDASIVYAADFSTFDPAWGTADKMHYVEGGKFVMKPDPQLNNTSLYAGSLFGDADIRATISEASGTMDEPAGLAFWAADAQNFYLAELQADGSVGVSRKIQGKWLHPVEFSVQPGVNKGLGQTNTLRVVTKGKSATVYVNDKQVVAFTGFPPDGLSQVGLHAESGSQACTWQFSDFVVRKLP